MTDLTEALPDKGTTSLLAKLQEFAGSWAGYSTLGSFALYIAGYLALRFHLTVLGVGTDLAVLDERYVFTGARFLIFLSSLLPSIVLLSLPLLALGWLLTRLTKLRRSPEASEQPSLGARVLTWWTQPSRLAICGILVALFFIQFLMRQCFLLSNLLLAECLPPPSWLRGLLLHPAYASLYFIGLVAGVCVTGGLWYAAQRTAVQTAWARALTGLLAVLVAIQFLLLPVNYGVLVVDKNLPKVADLGGVEPLAEGQEAWLIWEGKDGVTWLVRTTTANGVTRQLVTMPQKDVKRTRILRYDTLAYVLAPGACEAP